MKRILLTLIVVGSMVVGYAYGAIVRPASAVVEREVKVYNLTDISEDDMEIYANFIGKTLKDIKEIDEYAAQQKWQIEKDRANLETQQQANIYDLQTRALNTWQDGYRAGWMGRGRMK